MSLGKHLDSKGIERSGNEWGFNSFVTEAGAIETVRSLGGPGTVWYIWRLADGTYDFTATASPDVPGHPADLVCRVRLSGGSGSARTAVRLPAEDDEPAACESGKEPGR